MPDDDQRLASRRAAIARAARQVRLHPDADEAAEHLVQLRADYAAARLAEYIAEVVAAAPPLSSGQCDKLALLLRGAA